MKKTLLVLSTMLISSHIFAGTWAGYSDPKIMGSNFNETFSDLPMEGMIDQSNHKGWSGGFWSSKKGGINLRWNSPSKEGFKYKSPNKAAVMSYSQAALAQLSPSEKYDLFTGHYDYPLRTEASSYASRSATPWAGICHGWAPASLHHSEPAPKVMTNPDGLQIPFGSSDIKALVSYYYAIHDESEESTNQIGLRCFTPPFLGALRACNEDVNPGALHIIMANRLGIQKEGFLMDRDRYREVWNQPVVGFKSKILVDYLRPSAGSARGTVREMRVQTDLMYVNESVDQEDKEFHTWEPVFGTKLQIVRAMNLTYRLELNLQGKIIGGTWESADRPDFLWEKGKVDRFDGILSRIPELLND